MDLHYLKLFNTLASELSFSKTANTLFISQPAVSMQIKKLEKDLGLRLFDKVGKNLHLNENGRILHEYTKKIFSLLEEAETQLYASTSSVRGTISIGASNTPGTYILPKILGEFKESYPFVDTNLHIANTYEIERMLFDNRVEFAINGGDIAYSNQICVEKLADDEVILAVSPGNKLAGFDYVEPYQLMNAKFVTHEKNSMLYKLVSDIMEELGLPINIAMTLGYIDAIKQAVSANLGISAIPKSAISMELKFGLLKQINIPGKMWHYPYNLIYHKNKYISPACSKLIDLIRLRMKTTGTN